MCLLIHLLHMKTTSHQWLAGLVECSALHVCKEGSTMQRYHLHHKQKVDIDKLSFCLVQSAVIELQLNSLLGILLLFQRSIMNDQEKSTKRVGYHLLNW